VAKPELVVIDLRRGDGHEHPDIKVGKSYLAKIGSGYFAGTFSREWYGWNFNGWHYGLQLDKPGTNGSEWKALWRIDG
jgi:hypothetical protein